MPSPPNAVYIGWASSTPMRTRTYLRTPVLDLTTYDRAELTFSYWMTAIEGGSGWAGMLDRFFVEASVDGGATFPIPVFQDRDWAGLWGGTDMDDLPVPRWEPVTVDLETH